MDLVGTVVNAMVVGVVGLILGWTINGRLRAIERRLDRLEDRVERIPASVGERIDGLRSDLTQIALAVGARPRAENA